MMSVIARPDDSDRYTLPEPNFKWMDTLRRDLKRKRVAYSSGWGCASVDKEVREIVGRAVKVFERNLGSIVRGQSRLGRLVPRPFHPLPHGARSQRHAATGATVREPNGAAHY
jgi:hypothetical protein